MCGMMGILLLSYLNQKNRRIIFLRMMRLLCVMRTEEQDQMLFLIFHPPEPSIFPADLQFYYAADTD